MAIYFVDGDNGNDTNNGTSPETAWLTLTKAFSTIQAGDTLYIKPTTYRITSTLTLTNNGSSGNWISIFGDTKGEYWGVKGYPRITPLSSNEQTINTDRTMELNAKNYIFLKGLQIENGCTSAGSAGIFILNNSTYIKVYDCIFIYTLSYSSKYEQSGLIIAFGTSGTEMDIRYNVFVGGAWALHSLSSGLVLNFETSSSANAYVYNNLFLKGQRGISTYNQSRGDIRNNTFMFIGDPTLYFEDIPLIFKNNYSFFCYYHSAFNSTSNYIYPYYSSFPVAYSFYDFKKIGETILNHLDNLSDTTYYVNDDIYLNPRPLGDGRDIGCFEYIKRGEKETSVVRTGTASLKIVKAGLEKMKTFLTSGSHTISVYTKWSNYTGTNKPQLIIKQDNYCGISSDQIATAIGDGSNWEQLSINITLTKDAEIEIWLYARDIGSTAVTYFDDLNIT